VLSFTVAKVSFIYCQLMNFFLDPKTTIAGGLTGNVSRKWHLLLRKATTILHCGCSIKRNVVIYCTFSVFFLSFFELLSILALSIEKEPKGNFSFIVPRHLIKKESCFLLSFIHLSVFRQIANFNFQQYGTHHSYVLVVHTL
jgi:hypothetical protein